MFKPLQLKHIMGKIFSGRYVGTFSYFFQKTRLDIPYRLSLHEMSNPVFFENSKNISECRRLKILSRVLGVKKFAALNSLFAQFK